jgi:hypothetical protein
MATPKTPRKRTDKADTATETGAAVATSSGTGTSSVEALPDANSGSVVGNTASATLPASAATPPAAKSPTSDTPFAKKPVEEPPKTLGKEPASSPVSTTRVHDPSSTVVKRGPGFVPLVLGGVVAAGIGFGLARYVVPEGWPVPGSTPLQTQLTEQAQIIEALQAQIAALPTNDTSGLADEVQSVRSIAQNALDAAQVATNAPAPTIDLTDINDRLSALEDRPLPSEVTDPEEIAALKSEVNSLRGGLQDQKAAADTLLEAAEATRQKAAAEAETVLLQAALTKVEAAMQNGQPFASDLAILSDAGLTVPESLNNVAESGLPTLTSLNRQFDVPARAALAASRRGDMGNNWSDRLGSLWRSQTNARSLTPQEGSDPDAVLSRADAAVDAGDLQVALTEIAALPEDAQAPLADWIAQARLRLDAQSATADLATALSER